MRRSVRWGDVQLVGHDGLQHPFDWVDDGKRLRVNEAEEQLQQVDDNRICHRRSDSNPDDSNDTSSWGQTWDEKYLGWNLRRESKKIVNEQDSIWNIRLPFPNKTFTLNSFFDFYTSKTMTRGLEENFFVCEYAWTNESGGHHNRMQRSLLEPRFGRCFVKWAFCYSHHNHSDLLPNTSKTVLFSD